MFICCASALSLFHWWTICICSLHSVLLWGIVNYMYLHSVLNWWTVFALSVLLCWTGELYVFAHSVLLWWRDFLTLSGWCWSGSLEAGSNNELSTSVTDLQCYSVIVLQWALNQWQCPRRYLSPFSSRGKSAKNLHLPSLPSLKISLCMTSMVCNSMECWRLLYRVLHAHRVINLAIRSLHFTWACCANIAIVKHSSGSQRPSGD